MSYRLSNGGTGRGRRISTRACGYAAVVAGAGALSLGTAAGAQAAAMPSITLDYVAAVSDLQLPLVAEQLGYFKKYGVNVTVNLLPQAQVIPALVAGQVQIAAFQAPAPEVQLADGTPLKWLMQWEGHSDSALIARDGITSVSQLAGKTIGITSAGSSSQVLTQLSLKQAGNVSANLEPLGSVTAMESAFQSGAIAATIVSPPQDLVLVHQVPDSKILVNYHTQGAWPGGGLAALSSWTSQNQSTVVKVEEGMIAAINYIKKNPMPAAKIIAQSDDLTVPQALAGLKSTISLVDAEKTLAPNAAAEQTVLSSIKSTYPGAASLTPADTFNSTFYSQAVKKVPYKAGK